MNLENIISNDLCTGCGVCISEDHSKTSKMSRDSNGFFKPKLTQHSSTKNMAMVCPFNFDNTRNDEDYLAEKYLKNAINKHPRLGKYLNNYIGYAKNLRDTSSSGGVGSFIIKELLEKKIVDVVYSIKFSNGNLCYAKTDSTDNILEQSKTKYIPTTLEGFFELVENQNLKVAVTAVGCFIKAIRLKQSLNKNLPPIITIGIICGGIKSYFYTEYLAQKAKCEGEFSNPEYRVKNHESYALDYSFECTENKTNQIKRIPMKEVGDMWGTGLFKANACDLCDDITTELADISLGDAWLHPYDKDGKGNSLIITRSNLFEEIINDGLKDGELNLDVANIKQVYKSQVGAVNHKQKGLKTRVIELEKKLNIKINKRKKYFQRTPIEFQQVQIYRMHLREKSIKIWKENKKDFDNLIKSDLDILNFKTKRYHDLNKIRKKLKFLGVAYV